MLGQSGELLVLGRKPVIAGSILLRSAGFGVPLCLCKASGQLHLHPLQLLGTL